ncbi:beta strand repeat-containing protein [Rhodospirillum rubrum]|uniref:Hemolysin-type calcium-binding region n=1 Tax=Rhodospirillum rubrum (strain ATCC 11170 / ATH 1.1.1 / DSM 467 / LMG 4362 / NCIMB 8255 / S1) TaxID=269796 RepID=Q2RML2_RHORT|nr:hemolysin-type calcium-binding region [Rhodospirillum rubrum]ABC24633.1 Hemolysin-type calcium-binding region [Rhodospirillum rubrum ATCC 11170]MBK5956367.1 hemolysin-type calcium-binding region [Rhodospirillum rubrum]QXG82488.1 hemolysin-type calcium-binding region [Rhodospirillum rubrum]
MSLAFNATYYLTAYPDVAKAVSLGQFASAEAHYNLFGAKELRNPNSYFDANYYAAQNPDVLNAVSNGAFPSVWAHFLAYGAAEERAPSTALAAFNETSYLAANPDVAAAVTAGSMPSALYHFLAFGVDEGRSGSGVTIGENVGQTYTLTTGVDALTGTANNDTFNGYVNVTANSTNSTFTASDSIDGGAGKDSLHITVEGNAAGSLPAATITSVENFFVREVGGTAGSYDFGTVLGEEQVWSDRSTDAVTFANLAAGTTVGLKGDGATVLGNVTFEQVTAAAAVNIAIDGVGTTGAPTITNGVAANAITTNPTVATITSTGVANTVGAIDLTETAGSATAGIATLNINAETNLTATLVAADFNTTGAALKVAGLASSVDVGSLGVFKTIDASGLTAGGVTVGLNAVTTSFAGGAGNDVVTTAALAATVAASAINAGAGTADRLVVNATTDVDTAAEAQHYAGFEVLQVGAGVTADASLFTNSAINAVRFTGSGTINGLNATQAANVTVTANATPVIGITGASDVGQIDTVKITADDGAAAVSTITLANVNAAGVENLQFVATDAITVSSLTSSAAVTGITVTGAHDVSITTGALGVNVNTAIDASALTGAFTLDASAATGANGLSVTSGTGNDTITGTANADIIRVGAGNDTVTAGAGIDRIDLGAGNDTVVFGEAFAAGNANHDVVTGFTFGAASEDKYDIGFTVANGTTNATANLAALAPVAVADNGSASANDVIFTFSGANDKLAANTTATTAVANAVTALTSGGDFAASNVTAGDSLVLVLDNGTDSFIFHYVADATPATTSAADLELIGVVTGQLASQVVTGDFI